jgi:hypothetical protein
VYTARDTLPIPSVKTEIDPMFLSAGHCRLQISHMLCEEMLSALQGSIASEGAHKALFLSVAALWLGEALVGYHTRWSTTVDFAMYEMFPGVLGALRVLKGGVHPDRYRIWKGLVRNALALTSPARPLMTEAGLGVDPLHMLLV